MSSHKDLQTWQRAMNLVDLIYDLTKLLPADERFGLVTQLQRAAVSVPANIAEGSGRDSTKEFLRHISIARGSLAEVATFVEIIRRREFVGDAVLKPIESELETLGRLTGGLRRSLREKLTPCTE